MVNPALTTVGMALEKARADGQPWHVLARILREAIGNLDAEAASTFWDWAEAPSGLSPVMLRRYVATLMRIEDIAAAHDRDADGLLPASFTGAEVAIRIYDRDAAEGLAALTELRERGTTLEILRARLKEMPEEDVLRKRQLAKMGRAMRIEKCEVAFAAVAPGLFGEGAVARRRPRLRFFWNVGFEIVAGTGTMIAGADLYTAEIDRGDPLNEIAKSILLSLYFPAFSILFGFGVLGHVVSQAVDAIEALAPWIEILRIDADGSVTVVRQATRIPPENRTAEYASLRNLPRTIATKLPG
jgi:hypothetical protein